MKGSATTTTQGLGRRHNSSFECARVRYIFEVDAARVTDDIVRACVLGILARRKTFQLNAKFVSKLLCLGICIGMGGWVLDGGLQKCLVKKKSLCVTRMHAHKVLKTQNQARYGVGGEQEFVCLWQCGALTEFKNKLL